MFMLNLFMICYLTHMVSAHDVSNLLGFYTGFRKLCLCRCGISKSNVNSSRNGRLFGNEIQTSYEMPWLATIHLGTATIRGTLISDRHVVTAANPLYRAFGPQINYAIADVVFAINLVLEDKETLGHIFCLSIVEQTDEIRKSASELTVTLGSHLCKEGNHALNTSIEAILIHPGYSPTLRNNDIALLKLRNPIKFSQFISPICMPLYDTSEIDQLAWTVSWLKNKSETCLSSVATLPILSSQICHGNILHNSSVVMLSDKGCLGPLGTKSILCENDIGGPVMTRWIPGSPFRLVGVITNTSCEDEVPPLFTRTINNLLWIHENIRKDCQCF